MLSEIDVIEQLRSAMAEQGIVTSATLCADGQFHRVHVDGDAPNVRNGFYVLHYDERPAGVFGCNKRFGNETKFTWSAKGVTPMSDEERQALRERSARQKAEKQAVDDARHAEARVLASQTWEAAGDAIEHPYLTKKGVKSYGLRVGVWSKLDRDTGETNIISKNALFVPIRDERKAIHSLQAIFHKKINGRDKDFLRDGVKEGMFFSIGKPIIASVQGTQREVIIIGEGYATLATCHEATGHACIVAFDAGNLLPVAKKVRRLKPDACIVLAADNDLWTKIPIDNPGLTRATEAARIVGGLVAVPPFTVADATGLDEKGKQVGPSDFNDWSTTRGLEDVKAIFERALNPAPVTLVAESVDDVPPWEDGGDVGLEDADDSMTDLALNRNFTILGYNRGTYYVFQHGKKQIIELSKGDMGSVGLIELAPLQWWETHFPGEKTKLDTNSAAEFIIRTAEKRGIYDPSKVRGRGAWRDDKRIVYHHGDYLSVDGEPVQISKIQSKYVYELDRSLPSPHAEALSDEEGIKLLNLAEMFRWSKPGSAALVAGWVALAAMCGAMRWRPHIWLTGGAGSGKSTVLDGYIHHLLGGLDLYAQGNSTEPGIRNTLRADALPVLFEESESNDENEGRRIQNVISLVRQSSTDSEAMTLKGTAGGSSVSYHIRSMWCLCSIQVALNRQADVERMSVLTLRPKLDDPNPSETWAKISNALYEMQRDIEIPAKLFRRSINLLPVTLANIAVFTQAAGKKFNNQRDGDQYGTLLAGAWSLISQETITPADAEAWIDSYDWSDHRDKNDGDESQKALASLMEAHVRSRGSEIAVFELVRAAYGRPVAAADVNKETADVLLQRHGMRVTGDWLILSNNSNALRALMVGSTFEADYRGVLLRVKDADRNENKPIRINGVQSKCIRIPLKPLFEDDRYTPGVMPF